MSIPSALGTVVNLPMVAGTGDDSWLAAVESVVPARGRGLPARRCSSPSTAATRTCLDPLAHLRLTTAAYRRATLLVDEIAHRWCDGRWLATGGGGYDVYRVVPRSWALVWLAQAHLEAPETTPAEWRERWAHEAERWRQGPPPELVVDPPGTAAPESPGIAAANGAVAQTVLRLVEETPLDAVERLFASAERPILGARAQTIAAIPGHRPARGLPAGHPRLVRERLQRADAGPGPGLAGHRARRAHAHLRPHRQRQDPRRVPLVPRPAPARAAPADPLRRPARPLRLARSRRSSTTSTATCARRSRASRWRPQRAGEPTPREVRVGMRTGDTPADGARARSASAARHPGHHARVALPAPDLGGARDAARRASG